MNLRDDFEKDYRLDWEANDPAWCAYLAATERAVRIVRGTLGGYENELYVDEFARQVELQLKDES